MIVSIDGTAWLACLTWLSSLASEVASDLLCLCVFAMRTVPALPSQSEHRLAPIRGDPMACLPSEATPLRGRAGLRHRDQPADRGPERDSTCVDKILSNLY
jgi:hypothetical protein